MQSMEVQICSFSFGCVCVYLFSVNVVGERRMFWAAVLCYKQEEKGAQFCEQQTFSAAQLAALFFSLSLSLSFVFYLKKKLGVELPSFPAITTNFLFCLIVTQQAQHHWDHSIRL